MSRDLLKSFGQYFEIIQATTASLRDESFRLRYQVYCLETGFEEASRLKDGRETDVYDGRSAHSLIRYNCSDSPLTAAGVRLVLADSADAARPFPIEEHCSISLAGAGFDEASIPRDGIAEISRFAVSKSFKRRVGEAKTLAGVGPDTESYVTVKGGARLVPHLTLGLFAAIVRMSADNNITHWYAVMEPSLLRLLTRFGISFCAIGDLVDYHGDRQPCFGEIDTVMAGIYDKRRDVWDFITEQGRYWPQPNPSAIERSHQQAFLAVS